MSQVHSKKSLERDNISRKREKQDHIDRAAFAARLKARISELGINELALSRAAGIPKSSLNRWTGGESVPSSEQLFPLSDALGVSARWLLYGGAGRTHLADSADVDLVELPEHDLRELTDETRGPIVSTTPVRKDWLNRMLNQSAGLWLGRLPADLPRYELREGDLVFLRDVEPGEAQDGATYIVRIWGHLTVARIDAMLMSRMNSAEANVQDRALAPRDIGTEDGQAILIARVLGAPLRRL